MKKTKSEIVEFLGNIDLFICSSGFEERATSLGSTLNKTSVKNSVIFHLDDTYNSAFNNLATIKHNLTAIKTVEYPKNKPVSTFDIFFFELRTYFEDKREINVVVDITTFTREVLLILIKVLSLQDFINHFNVQLVYTPSEDYPEWLTKGVREIRSIFGYSGLQYPSKKLMLVMLSGFEMARTEEIIDSFEPNKLILGNASGIDAINSSLAERAKKNYDYLLDRFEPSIIDTFQFSCKNIIESKQSLKEVISKYEQEYNIVVSPMNNKISTLAVALLAIENENIQICYASANQYNIKDYSKGSDYFMTYNFNELLKS